MTAKEWSEYRGFFMRFRPSRFDAFRNAMADASEKDAVMAELLSYLDSWTGKKWKDFENIGFLGFDIGCIAPTETVQGVRNLVYSEVKDTDVKNVFLAEFDRGVQSRTVTSQSLPQFVELEKVVDQIKGSNDLSFVSNLLNIIDKYLNYFDRTGDYQPVGYAFNTLFCALQGNLNIDYTCVHGIVHNSIVKLFTIDATDDRLWVRWAYSFSRIGDPESREIVLWEAFRRRPDSERIHFALLKTFSSTNYNYQNRIRFADFSRRHFSFNRWFELEYCRLMGYSKSFKQALAGLTETIELINKVDEIRYEPVVAARIISLNWRKIIKQDKVDFIVALLSNQLKRMPGILGSIAYRLAHDHKNLDAARAVIGALKISNNHTQHEIADNSIAKLLAEYGGSDGLNQAIDILIPLQNMISRNHLAKLLEMRNMKDDVLRAEEILRANIKLDPDNEYATNQLAQLLVVHKGEVGRQEAINLLSTFSPDNHYSRDLLEKIQAGDNLAIKPSQIPPVSIEGKEPFDDVVEGKASFHSDGNSLPSSLITNSWARKLKFEVEFGNQDASEEAQKRLIDLSKNCDATEYLSFVYGVLGLDLQEDDSVGAMGAKMVDAFERKDVREFDYVAAKIPRFEIVSKFIKSLMGDEEASDEINLLRKANSRNLSWERSMIYQFCSSKYGENMMNSAKNDNINQMDGEVIIFIEDIIGSMVTLENIAA